MSVTSALKRFIGLFIAVSGICGAIFVLGSQQVQLAVTLAYVILLSGMIALLPTYLMAQNGVVNPYDIDEASALRHPKE